MKPGIHPKSRKVLFHDTAVDAYFLIASTVETTETAEYEGETYPYMTLDISSASHPFYTGKQGVTKNDGRIDKFNKRFNRKSK